MTSRTTLALQAAVAAALLIILGLVLSHQAKAQTLPLCYGELTVGTNLTAAKTDVGLTASTHGLQGGVGIGCDVMIDSKLVLGALGRYDLTSSDGSLLGLKVDAKPTWTLAARAGMMINPSTLAYGLLGYSGTNFEIESIAKTGHKGITYGLGAEFKLDNTPLWLKAEWTRTHWGAEDYAGVKVTPASDVIRAGVVIKFGAMK